MALTDAGPAGELDVRRRRRCVERVVEEPDLDFAHFRCCGDEDLYPFGCPDCRHPMVFCYECDTLYDDLTNLGSQGTRVNHSDVASPIFRCPCCDRPFEYFFMRDERYKVPLAEWLELGFGHLLAKGVVAEPGAAADGGGM
jgi:hypothetical protein